jgi:hypothetical protein
MEEGQNSEKIIGDLIKKRKAENEAFIKLLGAIENQSTEKDGNAREKEGKTNEKEEKANKTAKRRYPSGGL